MLPPDRLGVSERLHDDAGRLFIQSGSGWDVRLLTVFKPDRGSSHDILSLSDLNAIDEAFQGCTDQFSYQFLVIRQKNSWSRLQISYDGFLRVLSHINVSPGFTDFVQGFGFKTSQTDEDFGGYHRQIHSQGQKPVRQELSYNIRYAAEVSRGSEYPWVLRQMAVYQSYDLESNSSQWILLQPPVQVEHYLAEIVTELNRHQKMTTLDQDVMVNMMILYSTETNWRRHIIHLESEINMLDEKACFSRVGKAAKYDYSVAFSDCQELQQLRERLLQALSAVESNIEASIGIKAYLLSVLEIEVAVNKQYVRTQLELFQSRMRGHRRALKRLLEVSSGTSSLLSKILDFRNDESMRVNSANIREVLQAMRRESEDMRIIAQGSQVESRSMKILTSIAIAYLPANLVAAIFSTNIVQKPNNADNQDQIGRFMLITILLMLATISITLTWERNLLSQALVRMENSLNRFGLSRYAFWI